MPPKKRAAVEDSTGGPVSTPVPVTTVVGDKKNTIRLRVENFSKIKEDVLSEVKEIGGFPWQLKMSPSPFERYPDNILSLVCLHSREARVWHCKAAAKWRIMDVQGDMEDVGVGNSESKTDLYSNDRPSHRATPNVMHKIKRESKKYVKNDTIEIEVEIEVKKAPGDRFRKKLSIDFLTASDMFDAELSVGSNTVHVNKAFLSMHSPAFKAHFKGDSKDKIKLEEEDLGAIVAFLKLLYRVEDSATAANVEGVLKMAERFKVQCLVDHAEEFLYATETVKVSEKIRLAEKYNLPTLMMGNLEDVCKNAKDRQEVIECALFNSYSEETKKAVRNAVKKAPKVARDSESDDDYDEWSGEIRYTY